MPQWLEVDGIHFHSLREQNPATRERTLYIIKQALEHQLHFEQDEFQRRTPYHQTSA